MSAVIEEFEWLWWRPGMPGGEVTEGGSYTPRGKISIDLLQVTTVCDAHPTHNMATTQIYLAGQRDPHTLAIAYERFVERWRRAKSAA